MSFLHGPVSKLESPHNEPISDVSYLSKYNLVSVTSPSLMSIWTISSSNPALIATIASTSDHQFCKSAFLNQKICIVLTNTNRLYSYSLQTNTLSENFLEFPSKSPVIYFKLVGKYFFALNTDGTIFYINQSLTHFRTREISIPDKVKQADDSGGSLFLLFDNGQIGFAKQNDFDILEAPTTTSFAVSHRGQYIFLCTNNEWQLWTLDPTLSFVGLVNIRSKFAKWSPSSNSCFFFNDRTVTVTHFTSIINQYVLYDEGNTDFLQFDFYGQILFLINGSSIYSTSVACAANPFTPCCSAPVISNAILLPYKDRLEPVPLPKHIRIRLSLFGENALAVASKNSLFVLPFGDKITQSLSEGSTHLQFIKNNSIKIPTPIWIQIDNYSARALEWYGSTLIALCYKNGFSIQAFTITEDNKVKQAFSFELKGHPLSISVSGSKLLVAFQSKLSFFSLDKPGTLLSTSSFGQIAIKYALFLNPEAIAVLTNDRRLLLIFHTQILHVFEEVTTFQLTGSNAWPLLLIGDRWRLLGANNAELYLEEQMQHGLIIGVDGFSLFSIAPFSFIDFVHLVVVQSVTNNSLASAVSIISQSTDARKIEILIKVGIALIETHFDTFMTLLERFVDIEDYVLYEIFQKTKANINLKDFWRTCYNHNWFLTASCLFSEVTKEDCVDLLVKSEFSLVVVKNACKVFGNQLFEADKTFPLNSSLKWKLEDELTNFFRLRLTRNDYSNLAEYIPYLEVFLKRFFLRIRRERESNQEHRFNVIIEAMRKCTRQQLIDLSLLFEEVLCYDLLFCASYCIRNNAKCIECLEKQQRMTKFIDQSILTEIGY